VSTLDQGHDACTATCKLSPEGVQVARQLAMGDEAFNGVLDATDGGAVLRRRHVS
jgi:hypothetical protein